jgi:hypothetical protein
MRAIAAIVLAAMTAGCVTTESVRFQPKSYQEALVRDGNPAVVSRQKSSVVILRPAARQFTAGGRPIFVVGISNLTKGPLNFRMADIDAAQIVQEQPQPMKVVTYEELVTEERNRQIMAAVLTGIAGGINSAAASQSGYYRSRTTVNTPQGTYTAQTVGYSPTASAIAQANASVQNQQMMAATIERGQQNMAHLEGTVIKDNTLLPGEWYGGQLHLSPPSSEVSGAKLYTVAIAVGQDRHEFQIVQEANR